MRDHVIILHASAIHRLISPRRVPEDEVGGVSSDGALTDAKVDEVTGRLAADAIARFSRTPDERKREGAWFLSGLFESPVQWTGDFERKLRVRQAFVSRLERVV